MNRFDELLNKFLDNDLTSAELDEFNSLMNSSENQKKFNSIIEVESVIKKMPTDSAPLTFTEKLMGMLNQSERKPVKVDKFILFVSSLFIVAIIGTIIYFVLHTNVNLDNSELSSKLNSLIKSIHVDNELINKLFNNYVVFFVGVASSIFLLFNFIFTLDSYKSFKEKINKV